MTNWSDTVKVIHTTHKAVLVEYEGEQKWIADSLIHADSEVWCNSEVGDEGMLVIPTWLAEMKGYM